MSDISRMLSAGTYIYLKYGASSNQGVFFHFLSTHLHYNCSFQDCSGPLLDAQELFFLNESWHSLFEEA